MEENTMNSKNCTIRCGNWLAEIAPAHGANIVLLRRGEEDILKPWTEEIADPYLGGAPLLLPANRTAGGRFTFEGRTYQLPINEEYSQSNLHGSLHTQTFAVKEHGPAHICLEYENTGIYPFPFRITVCYHLRKDGLESRYCIENLAETAMPLTFALHTTFPEPASFCVPVAACQERNDHYLPTGRYVPLSPQEEHYCTGSPSKGVAVSGYFSAAGNTAHIGEHLSYRVEGFDHWVLFNGKGQAGLLCIEPQLGGVNALNTPTCPVIPKGGNLKLKTLLTYR